jgi:hypothetical protein
MKSFLITKIRKDLWNTKCMIFFYCNYSCYESVKIILITIEKWIFESLNSKQKSIITLLKRYK